MVGAANATETVAAFVYARCVRVTRGLRSSGARLPCASVAAAIFRCDARLELVRLSL